MLTELQSKKMTHYFNVLDYDRNEVIEKGDFEAIGENLCVLWGYREGSDEYNQCIERCVHQWEGFRKFTRAANPDQATLNEWLQFADKIIVNGSDELYHKYVSRVVGEIFDGFDTNKDGIISLDEFVDLFMAYRIEIRYSAKSFTKLDRNNDEMISREELLNAVQEFFRSSDKEAPGNWLFGFWEEGGW